MGEQDDARVPILVAGDASVPTGFGRVIEGVFRRLTDRFEIHHLGTNYHGDPHELPWKVYPASVGGGIWGTHRLAELIGAVKPRLIFIINDLWIAEDYMKALDALDSRPPVVSYTPIDSGPIEREAVEPLEGIDRLVTYTQFAKSEIESAVGAARKENPDFAFPEIEVVPHGVDTEDFHPLSEGEDKRRTARKVLFPDRDDLADAFIVLNANRNQPRKRIDVTMEGFAQFARNKPANVKLYLHMGVRDQGWDVLRLARRFDIEDRLIMSTFNENLPGFTTRHLNHVYNASDVGINTSHAEGWGLISFEHAATGAAQIVPAKGPCGELWEGNAILMEPAYRSINQKILTEGWMISAETVAEALDQVYGDAELRTQMSGNAFALATSTRLTWDAIAKQWRTLFDEVLAAPETDV